MKVITNTLFFLFVFIISHAQNGYTPRVATGAPLVGGRTMDMNVTWKAIDVSAFNGIDGSPFLTDEYVQAFVKTKSGEQFSNVWVKFSTYSNEILLENASQLVALVNVDSVVYKTKLKDGSTSNIILKTGYPVIEDKKPESIYQVLAYRNNIHLLKYYQTKVEGVRKMGFPDKKTFVTSATYYIYRPDSKSFQQVKLNNSLLTELKDYPKAKVVAKQLSVNFKKEADVVKLINAL